MNYDLTNYLYFGTLALSLTASFLSFYSAHKLGGELAFLLRFLALGLFTQSLGILYFELAVPFDLPSSSLVVAVTMLVSSLFYLISAWKARELLR